jgi:hypothetical protein
MFGPHLVDVVNQLNVRVRSNSILSLLATMLTAAAGVDVVCPAVMLMSLRAQLQAPSGNTRPIIAAQLNTDNLHDQTRCNVLLWVPRSNGTQFLAGHASGNIVVYKKVCAEALR